MKPDSFQAVISGLPTTPGIYQYFDELGELIYVGKAKNLRNRVRSYFVAEQDSNKTRELVKRIHRIQFTTVNSEEDAFHLENNLIKEFQPRYNIRLKDDKTYPWIVIKKEPFPRVFLTRKKFNDGSEYLGPFTHSQQVRELLEFIKQIVPLRTCSLVLQPKAIEKGKFKVCLEYHLGNCLGPCAGHQSADSYAKGIRQIRDLLKGNLRPVMEEVRTQMKTAAADWKYEEAERCRQKLVFLENYRSRSVVANSRVKDVDVFAGKEQQGEYFISYLMVRNGAIVQTHATRVENPLQSDHRSLLSAGIAQLRERLASTANEILVEERLDYPDQAVRITVPRAGDKKALLALAHKNLLHHIQHWISIKWKQTELDSLSAEELLEQMQEDLQLSTIPRHIECFDNSNFQGSYPVSAMVCFKNGKPSPKDHRQFHIRTVQGINDFASMQEAVSRRYQRLIREGGAFPQLVIIDGGKGQLNAAQQAIHELGLSGKMTLIGLAKNVEEIFFTGDTESLKLDYRNPSLLMIRRIRDAVHQHGLSFHQLLRSKGAIRNELENIAGIGKQTAEELLTKFRSVRNIQSASQTELSEIVGPAKARKIVDYFSKNE
ncbi:MAG: excinuclease ABC subunit UvrC [Bacteroidota bacterium]